MMNNAQRELLPTRMQTEVWLQAAFWQTLLGLCKILLCKHLHLTWTFLGRSSRGEELCKPLKLPSKVREI